MSPFKHDGTACKKLTFSNFHCVEVAEKTTPLNPSKSFRNSGTCNSEHLRE